MADRTSTIVFCGGGTIGHLAPSLAVAEAMLKKTTGIRPLFISTSTSDEREMIGSFGFPYRTIIAPKFPRGISVWWILFPLLFPLALAQSFLILIAERPKAIFSKGGYVSVPVALAGWMLRVPVILHESDGVMGLGNRLIGRIAQTVCMGFPLQTSSKYRHTGNPVRSSITSGNTGEAKRITGFDGKKPVILIIGGSQGAEAINKAVVSQLDALLAHCDIIHLSGHGKTHADPRSGYWSRPFVREELPHLLQLADVIVTRAGAGVLCEIAAVKKPAIAIPLRGVAQDHQLENAKALSDAGAIIHLEQRDTSALSSVIQDLINDAERKKALAEGLHRFFPHNASDRIADVLLAFV